jgi:uncharacterized protein YjbI with pentapeptide repeats
MKTNIIKKVVTLAAVMGMAFGLQVGGAFAYDSAAVETLKTTSKCIGCNFTDFNFSSSGIAMAGKDLTNANLTNAIFNNMTSLSGMNITGATMTTTTRFLYANLKGVIGLPTIPPVLPPAGTGTSLKAQFLNATWVDGTTKCKAPSSGTCTK